MWKIPIVPACACTSPGSPALDVRTLVQIDTTEDRTFLFHPGLHILLEVAPRKRFFAAR